MRCNQRLVHLRCCRGECRGQEFAFTEMFFDITLCANSSLVEAVVNGIEKFGLRKGDF